MSKSLGNVVMPEEVIKNKKSITGIYLKEKLKVGIKEYIIIWFMVIFLKT